MEKARFLSKNKISQLPETPGVYIFFARRSPIYIGKARNIKERVKNHSLDRVEKVGYVKTDSEIEALILEAKLIKKHQPKNNVVWKDDKNYFYVVTTKEDFPQVFITHQIHQYENCSRTVGPFVDGKALKETLKVLRKAFPYRTCKKLPKHACLWYQLQRCPAPCLFQSKLAKQIKGSSASIRKECRKNIKNILKILQGKKGEMLAGLKKQMKKEAASQNFEEAAKIRNQITSLEKIMLHARVLDFAEAKPQQIKEGRRAEAYDIANIQGKMATGAMVVFIDGKPDKSQYRQFKIKGAARPNDIAMLKEVLERRLKHQEWPYPDLILIDGGRAQLNVALKFKSQIPASPAGRSNLKNTKIMSLAKKNNELYMEKRQEPVLLKSLPRETFNLILRLRDEAHRFARRYHHKLREKSLLG